MEAKEILRKENLTCVLCKGKKIYKSKEAGIKPLLSFITKGIDFEGFSAADKVIGKAAALLFVHAKIKEVYGETMSNAAVMVFKKYEIKYSYGTRVSSIINKKGDGICPMETAVKNISDPKIAFDVLSAKAAKKLGFGLMRMPVLNTDDPTSFDFETCNKMVDEFIANGFSHFDTAYIYHGGKSENMVKECITKRYPRSSFRLATKLPMWEVKTPADQERIFNEQLDNCGVEYFDYYLLHSLNYDRYYNTVKKCKSFDFGFKKKAAGKIKKLGFSFHDEPQLLDEILTAHPNIDFVLLQINYLDWDNPSIQSRKCYEVARKHNIPIMIMEPVKGGQLATVPEDAEKLMKEVNPDMSVPSWAIRYAASLEGVFMVLSGMSTIAQLEDNMSFMKEFKPLSGQELETINKVKEIIKKDTVIGCTSCGYCVKGCPENIAIPNYFALYNEMKRSKGSAFIPEVYYANISVTRGRASKCVKCGLCESICPQKLEIIKHLADVAALFETGGD